MIGGRDVTIRQLRIRLGRGTPRACAGRVRDILAHASWDGGHPDEIVFVRRLYVRGYPSELAKRADTALRAAVEQARRSPGQLVRVGVPETEAILFPCLDALGAGLAQALVEERAGQWPWTRAQDLARRPIESALGDWLSEHCDRLSSIFARLERAGHLAAVFDRIDEPAAARLLGTLLSTITTVPILGYHVAATIAPPLIPTSLRARWHRLVHGLTPASARVRLLAALALRESRPMNLTSAPAAREAIGLAAQELVSAPSHPAISGVTTASASRLASPAIAVTKLHAPAAHGDSREPLGPAIAREDSEHLGAPSNGSSETVVRPESRAAVPTTMGPKPVATPVHQTQPTSFESAPAQVTTRPEGRSVRADHPGTVPQPTTALHEQDQVRSRPSTAASCEATATSRGANLVEGALPTDFGGLFYLVNVVGHSLHAHPELMALLERPAGGWQFWKALGLIFEVPPSDALVGLIDEQIALCGDGQADTSETTSMCSRIAADGRLRWGADVWTPALVRVPGHVVATRTHWDLFAPLSAVRVEVRLAALDLNPGWVPWLGRVLAIHFGDEGTHA